MPDRQIDLTGAPIKLPTVRLSNDFIVPWNRNIIINQILQDTSKCPEYYSMKPASRDLAEEIADDVEGKIERMKMESLSGHLIRELVCISLAERGYEEYSRISSRCGISVMDAHDIDVGQGFEATDNANLQGNPETAHKKKADKLAKEQALAMMPPHLVEAHRDARIHIHDLEYFTTRFFCQDWDLRYFLYYGLIPDGNGTKASVSAPAKRAEVAVLHAVKVLGSAQTNFSVCEDENILISDNGVLKMRRIGDYADFLFNKYPPYLRGDMECIDPLGCSAISFNTSSNELQVSKTTHILRHKINEPVYEIITGSGRRIKMTGSHSAFVLENGLITEKKTTDMNIGDYLVVPIKLPNGIWDSEMDVKDLLEKHGSTYKILTHDGMLYVERGHHTIPRKIQVNRDFIRLLGYLSADGYLTHGRIGIAMGTDTKKESIKDAIRCIKSVFGIEPSLTEIGSTTHITVRNVLATEFLDKVVNIGLGAYNKRVPDLVFNVSNELKKEYISTYFADGHSRRREISFKTSSKDLCDGICNLLLQLGVSPRISKFKAREDKICGRLCPIHEHYKIVIGGTWIEIFRDMIPSDRNNLAEPTQNSVVRPPVAVPILQSGLLDAVNSCDLPNVGLLANIRIKKHVNRERAIRAINLLKDHVPDVIPNRLTSLINSDLGYDPIKSISKIDYSGYVYDLSIEGHENFVGGTGSVCLHNSGGEGYYNFLTFLAPYFEGKPYEDIKQLMQMFVYEMTQMTVARGGQIVFSSVQLSPGVPTLWKDKPVVMKGYIFDGKQAPLRTYSEFEREVRLSFKALMEVMLEGDYWGKPFNFPKPEISLEPDFMQEDEKYNAAHPDMPTYNELYRLTFQLASKFGTPYYDNQIPQYRGAGKGISCYQCCTSDDCYIVVFNQRYGGVRIIPISDLAVDDTILTMSGFSGFDDILIQDYDGELIKLKLKTGRSIFITPDHSCAVVRNGTITMVPASDIKVKDRIPVSYISSSQSDIPLFENRGDTQSMAYFLGVFAAEGTTSEHSNNSSKYMGICLGSHETDFISKMNQIMGTLFGKHIVNSPVNRGRGISLTIGSRDVYYWLVDNHISLKGRDMEVPPFILTASADLKWAFLQGYFRGDGCLRRNGVKSHSRRIEMNTISRSLAEGLIHLLGSLGITAHYTESIDKRPGRKPRHIITINKRQDILDFLSCTVKNPQDALDVSKVEHVPYKGKVYDPVNVNGHIFVTGQGIATGNCAYQFSANPETDTAFNSKLWFRDGAHFSMGSGQVVTVNCPRAAYEAEGDDDILIATLKEYMDLAAEVFLIKRNLMTEIVMANRIPFALQRPRDPRTGKLGAQAVDIGNLTYVIGIIGINEMVQHQTGYQLYEDKSALRLAIKTLVELNKYAKDLSNKYGFSIGVARTPAETTAQRFAVADLLDPRYNDHAKKVVRGDLEAFEKQRAKTLDLPVYYTNGTHLPVNAPVGMPDRILHEHVFFPLLAGGNILHLFMGEKAPDPGGLMDMAMRLAKNTQAGYFAFTRDLTVSMHRYHSF